MKKGLFIITVIICSFGNSYGQPDVVIGNRDIIDTFLYSPSYKVDKKFSSLLAGKPDLAFSFLEDAVYTDPTTVGKKEFKQETFNYMWKKLFDKNGKLRGCSSIVFVENPVNEKGEEDTTSVKTFTINNNDLTEKDDYALGKKEILLVFIGNTATKVNKLHAHLEPTYFSQTLKDAIDFASKGAALKEFAQPELVTVPVLFVLLKKEKIRAPSDISFNVPYFKKEAGANTNVNVELTKNSAKFNFNIPSSSKEQEITYSVNGTPETLKVTTPTVNSNALKLVYDSVKIKNHEKNHLVVSVGISGTYLDYKDFSMHGDTVTVKLDTAQKRKISSNLMIGIEWYPFGRDLDRYSLGSKPFYRWWSRFGVFGAAKMSSNPLESLFLGATLSLTKEFSVHAGCLWQYQTPDQTRVVNGVSNVTEARKYLNTSYKGTFSFGITLSPSQAVKALSPEK
jgi:hypothetical protein